MPFISVAFIPGVFLLYCVVRRRVKLQNFILLCASIFFYACYDLKCIAFLVASIIITYFGAILGKKYHKKYILVALAANIGSSPFLCVNSPLGNNWLCNQ